MINNGSNLNERIMRGLYEDIPFAKDVAPGTLYFSSDTGVTLRSNGTNWESYSGPYHQTTVELDNDDIIHLPTIPIELLPAQGENKAVMLLAAFLLYEAVIGYTNVNDSALQIYAEGQGSGLTNLLVTGFLANLLTSEIRYLQLGIAEIEVKDGTFDGYTSQKGGVSPNTRLIISDAWNGSDYVGGNAANRMRVSILYTIIDVTTGLFE